MGWADCGGAHFKDFDPEEIGNLWRGVGGEMYQTCLLERAPAVL